jgi:hypothetical protein
MVSHVNDAHALQSEEFAIADVDKLAIGHSTDSASFANKGSPFSNVGEAKASFILAATHKGSADRETTSVVSSQTRTCHPTVFEKETGIGEVTAKDAAVSR